MISIDNIENELIVNYPCTWGYKIIGRSKKKLEETIIRLMKDYDYKYNFSHSSKRDNFHSYNIKCKVSSQEERLKILSFLREDNSIEMVI